MTFSDDGYRTVQHGIDIMMETINDLKAQNAVLREKVTTLETNVHNGFTSFEWATKYRQMAENNVESLEIKYNLAKENERLTTDLRRVNTDLRHAQGRLAFHRLANGTFSSEPTQAEADDE
jgi:hypothetical protein